MINAGDKRVIPRKLRKSAIPKLAGKAPLTSYSSGSNLERGHLGVVERITSLFEPDVLAPAQYFDGLRSKTLIEPEKRLMVAILEDAINCFQDNALAESGKRKSFSTRLNSGSWTRPPTGYFPFEISASF